MMVLNSKMCVKFLKRMKKNFKFGRRMEYSLLEWENWNERFVITVWDKNIKITHKQDDAGMFCHWNSTRKEENSC